MFNKVILIGEIAMDPELRYFKDNSVITVIKLITRENINNIKDLQWHRIILKGKNKVLKKNMVILVEGKIKTRRWMDNIKYNYITEIFADIIKILDYKNYNNNKNKNNDYVNNDEKEEDNESDNYGFDEDKDESINKDLKYDSMDDDKKNVIADVNYEELKDYNYDEEYE
ncbi:Single-stranded DNA-binding protein [Candidatus Nasuia deltocephalinicola]|uniref:Single-stranded DNA-binding protein n=1 Tax=Candidatus Nasuia deltocephalincola TaxID=1160784 RepID=A0A0S2UPC2_9PROT|nr:Single-stranded DNA-binding protein [Candidatus Nasuia deltocephalinicola]